MVATLKEYHRNIGDAAPGDGETGGFNTDSDAGRLRAIIEQLVQYLESL